MSGTPGRHQWLKGKQQSREERTESVYESVVTRERKAPGRECRKQRSPTAAHVPTFPHMKIKAASIPSTLAKKCSLAKEDDPDACNSRAPR